MIDYRELVGRTVDERTLEWRVEDTLLYALATGWGGDPTDPHQLRCVYEENLLAPPAMTLVVGYPGFWLKQPEYAADWARALHAEEAFTLHAELPAAGRFRAQTVVTAILDRGKDKGAAVYSTKTLHDEASGQLIANVDSMTLLRGDGGFEGPTGPRPAAVEMPQRAPDEALALPSLPQQALLYRLCGDFNPLHADPVVARRVGFDRPILHGRCTLGIAQHALIRRCGDYDPRRLRALRVRFTAPFYPGETLRTRIWREPDAVYFDAECVERGVTVLSNGQAQFTPA